MRFVKIDPPGSWCLNEALFEMLRRIEGRRFLEVGCGAGGVSLRLLEHGYTGTGIDFSLLAIEQASRQLKPFITKGKYRIIEADLLDRPALGKDFDIVIGLLIMEHIQDDTAFLEILKSYLRPGGHIIISVPGRKDKWSLEDETVGHIRRYDRQDLFDVFEKVGFINPEVWSIAVPAANILFGLSNLTITHSKETDKIDLLLKNQTKTSGVREIPFKTVFPPFFKIVLNRVTLWPLFVMQRLFYHTDLGLTMLARAQRPEKGERQCQK